MKIISLVLFLICFFFYSFSNKNEIIKVDDYTPGYVNSLVQSTDYLKLYFNSPMKLCEYTANKNNKSSLIKYSSKDIIFIPNKGQIIDTEGKLRLDIFYKAELNGIVLYLTNKGMSFIFIKYEDAPKNLAAGNKEVDAINDPVKEDMKDKIVKMYRMDLDIVGMNTNVRTVNEEQTEEYFNYYYAHCPDGITNVHGYRKVIYENAYDNIDIVYYSNEKGLKYDFIVKPGGNVSDIKLKYNYDDEVYITEEGKIRALNPFGEIETDVLYTYQSDGKVIENNYIKDTDGTIRIITGEYDETQDLIIDPYIGATFYGGSGPEAGMSIKTDSDNNILAVGTTSSTNFPVQNPGGNTYYQGLVAGSSDVYILKFYSNGTRLWATYYGGNNVDYGTSLCTDRNNNILVTGNTFSLNFPLFNPGGGSYFQDSIGGGSLNKDDIYILKFSSFGERLWATYYGGINSEDGESISTDSNNSILITGKTGSVDFPLMNPGGGAYFQDSGSGTYYWIAYILKFDSNGVRKWATLYGESDAGEGGKSITADSNSNILVTGFATGDNFPVYDPGGGAYFQGTHLGYYDAFILKFTSGGIRLWATYYGGSGTGIYGNDEGISITTDGNNNILITGFTSSTDFPIYDPGGGAYYQSNIESDNDSFILKFNSSGVRLWATYYGGNYDDNALYIDSDINNNILITGNTISTNFPIHNPGGGAYYQNSHGGGLRDAFILKFNSNNKRTWATYYGGNYDDFGSSVTSNANNNIYVFGSTFSPNFPVFNPGGGAYFQGSYGGYVDAFILGFDSSGVISDIQNMGTIIPEDYALYQNYPNPFNPTTSIKFDIPKSSHVKLIVYNILGKEITTLVNEKLGAGNYEVDWDGTGYPSGVYFYKLLADGFVDVKKMVLMK